MHVSTRIRILVALISAIGLSAASLVTVQGHAQGATNCSSQAVQTNPIATHPPQSGFDPYTASEAELLAHGYPFRPAAGPGLAAWKTAISRATHHVPPNPTPSLVCFGPVASSSPLFTSAIEYAEIWAGHIIPQAAVGNANLYGSFATWSQPSVPGDPNYSNSNWQNAPGAAFWTGTGIQH